MDNIEMVLKVLKVLKASKEPMKTSEIAEKSGIDKKELDKIIKKLKTEEKVVSPKRCYYALA